MKLKFQSSPYQSLRRSLPWGEKAESSLGFGGARGGARTTSKYSLYESHVGESLPLERISRGPDGRFVVQSEAPSQERLAAMIERYSLSLTSSESSMSQPEPYLHVTSPSQPEEPGRQTSVNLRPKNSSLACHEAKALGFRQACYFDYSSSSPTEEAKPFCIMNISPVTKQQTPAVAATAQDAEGQQVVMAAATSSSSSPSWLGSPSLPEDRVPSSSPAKASTAQSGILQYLSLPFFKEMNVDGDWPSPEEEEEEGGQPSKVSEAQAPDSPELTLLGEEDKTASPAYMDTPPAPPDSTQDQASAKSLLGLPDANTGPAKAALLGTLVCSSYLSCTLAMPPSPGQQGPWLRPLPPSQPLMDENQSEPVYTTDPSGCDWLRAAEAVPAERHKLPSAASLQGLPAAEKLLRGSLTSQSSGRGSVSFLRPPSLAPSLGGSYLSSPFGEVASWQSSSAGEEGRPHREDPSVAATSKR